MKSKFIPAGMLLNGTWRYKLPDPYNQLPYLPLDANELARRLGMSYRTALRICRGERAMSDAHRIYLQVVLFGYIPDAELMRGRWFFRDGCFMSHRLPGLEFPASEIMGTTLLRLEYLRTASALEAAKRRIAELEAPPPLPANVLTFPARRRPGRGPDGAA